MCKKCKTCGESNLGVKIIETKAVAARTLNGEVVETYEESYEVSQVTEVTYCFTCKKDITENDLYETVKCASCGNEVESVTEEGLCPACAETKRKAEEEANRIASLSHEELVALIMSGKLNPVSAAQPAQEEVQTSPAVETVKEEPTAVKEEVKEETNNGEALSVLSDEAKELADAEKELNNFDTTLETKEEVKVDETKENKTKTTRKKAEPAEVKQEEVYNAAQTIADKVKSADAPASANGDVTQIQDEKIEQPVVDTTIENKEVETTIPGVNDGANVDEEDIMAQLDSINLDNFNINGSLNQQAEGGFDQNGNELF